MPISNTWDKNISVLTGIFPNCHVVRGKTATNSTTIQVAGAGESGVFIPFNNLTGLDNAGDSPEIGDATTQMGAVPTAVAGGSRFMLGVLEAAFAAQQNAASANRLTNCVVTRSALSVVDENTLQKTFTVKFKLNHTSQEVEAE
jgi:hypothetical protein